MDLGKIRKRRCPCGQYFVPRNTFQRACCLEGSLKILDQDKAEAAKKERAEIRRLKTDAKPLQYWHNKAKKPCHAYIRMRDRDEPCISCGTWDSPEWHAGHFIPVGRSSSIRYDEQNIHKQCNQCNVFKGGNQTQYEIRLKLKIGPEAVERLKMAPRLYEWTREELEAIEARYKAKLKELKACTDETRD